MKAGEDTLPWAISCFFFNEKKINIFRVMHIALFAEVIYCLQILLKKKIIIYFFSYKVTFSMTKVNFDSLILLKEKV